MSEKVLIFQGAEAKIYHDEHQGIPVVRKERFVKHYRHPALDQRLTKSRTKAEVKALQSLKAKCPALSDHIPTVVYSSVNEIVMTKLVDFKTLHQAIVEASHDNELVKCILCKTGKVISDVHKCGLIHGDLTTTNFMINQTKIIVPIDFGLSSHSTSSEDRAVDLYVFERSMLTTGLETGYLFECLCASYSQEMGSEGPMVMKKLAEVQARGRKRDMVG
ncbi:EKC/KEOPS complex subunit Tp53rkb-like [Brevipalpus obovatus]|uniref:EKC/KEOPS complex subunit Tp53rkb-like n=1 Tax=Brevipalpus obovatus TaxID=246614 RepID=UPI003D9DE70E